MFELKHASSNPTSAQAPQSASTNAPSCNPDPQQTHVAKRNGFDGWEVKAHWDGSIVATNSRLDSAVPLVPPTGQPAALHTYTMIGEPQRGVPTFKLTPYFIGIPVEGGAVADGLNTTSFALIPENTTYSPKVALRFPYEGILENGLSPEQYFPVTYLVPALTNVAVLGGAPLPVPTEEALPLIPTTFQPSSAPTSTAALTATSTQTSITSATSNPQPHHSNAGVIAGATIASIGGVALLGVAAFLWNRNRLRNHREARQAASIRLRNVRNVNPTVTQPAV